jgi:hypothetical protein
VFLLIAHRIELASFRKFRLRLSLLLPLFQSHPRASTILVDEFDSGELKCVFYHLKCCPARFVASGLDLPDRYYAYTCLFGQVRLAPIE